MTEISILTIRSVFNVGTLDDLSLRREERSPDSKFRVRVVGELSCYGPLRSGPGGDKECESGFTLKGSVDDVLSVSGAQRPCRGGHFLDASVSSDERRGNVEGLRWQPQLRSGSGSDFDKWWRTRLPFRTTRSFRRSAPAKR